MSLPVTAIVTEVPFWRRHTGVAQRVAALHAFLIENGFSVPVFYVRGLVKEDKQVFAQRPLQSPISLPSFRQRLYRQLRQRSGGRGEAERCAAFQAFLARQKPKNVIFVYASTAYLLEGIPASVRAQSRMIVDTIDVMSLRTARYRAAGYEPLRPMLPDEERAILSQFDGMIAIQCEEARYLRKLIPEKPVWAAAHPGVAQPFYFREEEPLRLLFLGAQGEHNRIALQDFLDQVWPALNEEFGAALHFDIVGKVSSFFADKDLGPGVSCTPFLQDLAKAYADADIVVNPVYVGSGLKIKNVEALCYAKPLVTTPIGAEGFDDGAEKALCSCADPKTMLATLRRLLQDEGARRQQAQGALRYARDHLNEEAVYKELLTALKA